MSGLERMVTVELSVGPPHAAQGVSPALRSAVGDGRFRFELHHKDAVYGNVAIPHFWMNQSLVYGTRNNSRELHQRLVDCFLACCLADPAPLHEDDYQTYVLASLLPNARTNGSRRVLIDSIPPRGYAAEREESLRALDQLLGAASGNSLDELAFARQTADAIGPREYGEEVWDRYRQLEADLLGEARQAVRRDGASEPQMRWQEWMQRIGRRGGNEDDKEILDILSYEARAAVHECYSTVWEKLLPELARQDGWSEQAERFHHLWHLDQTAPANEDVPAKFHLFHGHIFALHPACGELIQTPTGRRLIGDWLSSQPPEWSAADERLLRHARTAEFHRLLNGVSIAVYSYAVRRGVYAELRRQQPQGVGSSRELEQLQERRHERRAARRRRE